MDPLPILDDYAAADPARAKLQPKRSLLSSLVHSKKKRDKGKQKAHELDDAIEPLAAVHLLPAEDDIISLSHYIDAEEEAEYQWVALYENQRGLTVFSTPYFSRLGLLPTDPLPFTMPGIKQPRSHQLNVTLDSYPLPDGNWQWVSKTWMVDMRSDSGEVQHDGFEYNCTFRSKGWSPNIGAFSFVRRRRWVRLMVRPAKERKHPPRKDDSDAGSPIPATARTSIIYEFHPLRKNRVSTISSSIATISSEIPEETYAELDDVWQGDVELDWLRYRVVAKGLATDGKKLEIWRRWLGLEDLRTLPPRRQWTEDEENNDLSPPPVSATTSKSTETQSLRPRKAVLEYITAVVAKHGDEVLQLLIFPESRARLIELFGLANVLPSFGLGVGEPAWTSNLDFHSYTSGLGAA